MKLGTLTIVPQAEWLWRKFQAHLELMLWNYPVLLVGKSEFDLPLNQYYCNANRILSRVGSSP